MNPVVIIVAVVAVVAIAVLVILARRGGDTVETPEAAAGLGKGPERPAKPEEVGPVTAVPPEAKAGGEATEPAPAAVAEAPPRPEPKPVETEEEVAERVKGSLAEARRMLEELQKQAGDQDAGGPPGTVDIMTEGLEEVQALADGGKWDQARDKAEALHAQLRLMLQAARRESSSD